MSQEEMNNEVLECARYGESDDLRALLQASANVNHRDAGGNTAVHKASANGEVSCLQVLKDFGAEYSANAEGNLPTHWAAQNAKVDALRFLIETYGDKVDVLAQNRFGRSSLTEAFQSQNEAVIELCLSHPSANEERLLPGGKSNDKKQTLDESLEGMEISEEEMAMSPEQYLEQHAVIHNMALLSGVPSEQLVIRELPITRADDPFGTESAPEDDTTGLGLWPAAVLAARWVATDLRAALAGKVVVELGCGCGLPGLSAARYCGPRAVYLTDIHAPTLSNAAHNAALNAAQQNETVFSSSPAAVSVVQGCPVSVLRVSWTDPTSFPPEPADVLLGSDLVYDEGILSALTQAVTGLLVPGGVFYYIAPEEGRAGMDSLVSALAACGVVCEDQRPCPAELFANPLVGAADGLPADDAYVLHFYDLSAKKPHVCFTFRRGA